jgi:hypothetical protein
MDDRDDIDPLDSADPVRAGWQRFRTRYATARLLDWLFSEVEDAHPDYFRDLYYRFQSSFDHGETLKRDGSYDGWVPLVALDGTPGNMWIAEDELSSLSGEFFPHGPKDTPRMGDGAQLVALLLYSALESLAADLGIFRPGDGGSSVVRALDKELDLSDLDPERYANLVDLRETRNLIAHSGGRVNERYCKFVGGTALQVGENRVISREELMRFAQAVHWAAGLTLRLAGGTEAA